MKPSPIERDDQVSPTKGWRDDARAVAAYLGSALLGGIAGGLVVGGVGGRLAMLVMRLTSGDDVVGLISDDGFEIGRLSGDTFFLLLFGTALGAAVGILYLLSRPWIPERSRAAAFGLLGGLVGGSGVVHADGIDFRLLEPTWLAVLMFVLLPAMGAAVIAVGVERLLARTSRRRHPWLLFLPLLGLGVLGPLGLAILAVAPLGIAVNQKVSLDTIWTSQPVAWIGRVLLIAWGIAAGTALIHDLRGIFGS